MKQTYSHNTAPGKALFIIILCNFIFLSAIKAQQDTISFKPGKWEKTKLYIDKLTSNKLYQMTNIGVPLIVGGLIVKGENDHFRALRNRYIPTFQKHYDDYLQYIPAAVMLGLKVSGVEGRSSWGRMLTSDAFSAILMAASVNAIKSTTKVMRPDGSSHNSFPSGHSATAFMAATMLHKEYGLTRSPWYSIGAYSIATVTAVSRQLNNRHWLSDIMVGAGIGILSTEFGYYFADLIFKDKGIKHRNLPDDVIDTTKRPSSFGYYIGFGLIPTNLHLTEDILLKPSTGSTAGFEGTWFFSPYIGIGGRFTVSNIPIALDNGRYLRVHSSLNSKLEAIQPAATDILSLSAGTYFSYPLTNRWLAGTKFLLGTDYSSGNSITAFYHDTPTENELKSMDIVNIKEFHTFSIGTGISLSYIVKRNFGVKLFLDYNFIPTHTSFQINDENGSVKTLKSSSSLHMLVLGASANILF